MSRGINKCILIGNLGQDPEVKYMPSGAAVTTISLATSEQWTDKQTGQKQERTEWHRVVFFARLAEIAGEYLKKGSKVYLEGQLRTRKWQDQAGQDRYTTEILARSLQMLDTPANAQHSHPANQQSGQPHQGQYYGRNDQQQQPQPHHNGSAPPPGFDDYSDDIPF